MVIIRLFGKLDGVHGMTDIYKKALVVTEQR